LSSGSTGKRYKIILNDLPHNDWNTVFQTFGGVTLPSATVPLLYGCPNSYYGEIAPPNTIHFGFSSSAFHWLSAVPVKLQSHISIHHRGCKPDGPVFKAYKKKAADDWRQLLHSRATELQTGGEMVMIVPAVDETDGTVNALETRELLNDVLQDSMQKYLISQQEYVNFNIPTFPRTKTEFIEGFTPDIGLKLQNIELHKFIDPNYENFSKGMLPLNEYAHHITNSIRAWSENSLKNALSGTKETITSHIYKLVNDAVLNYPHRYKYNICQAVITCTKEK